VRGEYQTLSKDNKTKDPPKPGVKNTAEDLRRLRRRLAQLEKKEAEHRRTEKALRESEEKYRTVVTGANDGIAVIQDEVVQFVNPWLAEMGGYEVEDLVGHPFTEFLPQAEVVNMLKFYENRMAGEPVPAKYEMILKKKNGDFLYADINTSVIPYRNRTAALIFIRDFTRRKRTEKLKDSIFHISEAAISSETLDDLFLSIHKVIADLMPAKNFYIALYEPQTDILSFPYFVDEYDTTPAPKKPGRGLTEYVLRTGNPVLASPEVFAELESRGEVESIGAPSIDWLGVPLKIYGQTIGILVVQSYTEGVRFGEEEKEILKFVSDQVAMAVHRKKAEAQIRASLEEKDVLLKEIHHRVKNNMQVISSLLNLQCHHIQDPHVLDMFKESQRRIRSMALIHERLYQSSDLSRIEFSQYLRNLATHLFHSYQVDSSRIRLALDAEEVFLNINTAIPCGLIVNELVSNALKHGFPDGRSGEVGVELHRIAGDGYELKVRDDGVGFPEELDFRRTQTLGMQIVVTLVSQIDGRLDLQRQGNTCFTLEFNELQRKKRS
jgi:PAS domain S-box-containing protein